MAEGHEYVLHYPIGYLVEEAEIASGRINARIATEAASINLAINACFSKPASKSFDKYLAKLRGE